MTSKIKIASINIHGLRNRIKRRTFFTYLKRLSFDIVCIQESYITEADKNAWEKEWGGTLFHTSATHHSMGQVILIKKNFPYQVQPVLKTERILTIKILFEDHDLHITNIYAPTESNKKRDFFHTLRNHVCAFDNTNQFVCGDFNCVQDNKQDIVSGAEHPIRDVNAFNAFITECDLTDVWRLFNTDCKEFTWSRAKPFTARRLDYILSTDNVFSKIMECSIQSVAQSDHRLVHLLYNVSHVKRGPSYWKFNESLLRDELFVNQLNDFIDTFQNDNTDLDDQLKWDLCKLKIREFCIEYGKNKSRNQKQKYFQLLNDLDEIEKTLSVDPTNDELLRQRNRIKLEAQVHEIYIAKGAQTRARAKFIEEGEKNTKYFLNLEKAQSNAKIMDRVLKENGQITTNQNEIIQELVKFYCQRYQKTVDFQEETANDFLTNIDVPQLPEDEKNQLEGLIKEDEIATALKSMKNGSAPGSDGLTTGFLKFFWCKIKDMVLKSVNAAFIRGEMSTSQKRAIITLIHKGKQLPREDLNNWRPISLTNSDYKLMAKTLAIRLSSIIKNVIKEDQVGFLRGRNISTLIRLIDDTINYLDVTQKPGILIALDYKAAFDTISKEYIAWSFKRFNFGKDFVRWVEVIMKNTNSCINYMGWLSESIEINSGIRQGRPFSPMAFILALELLAIRLRADENVKGIKLPKGVTNSDSLLKVLLYADDITLFLEDRNDLKNALTLVSYFSKFSGLAMNRDKSEAMWLGSNKNNHEELHNMKWKNQVKILGIYFNNSISASEIEDNWLPRIEKINRIMSNWAKRNLSIMGKICIVKSLLLSQIVYVLQALAAPEDILKKVNTMLFRFIWKKKYSNTKAFEKVKRKIICKETEQGGLKMINVFDMQNSFLLSWASKLQNEIDEKWKRIPIQTFSKLGKKLCCFSSNLDSKYFKGFSTVSNMFWKSVLKCWLDNNKEINTLTCTETNVVHQCIWNNENIRYKKQSLFFQDWINAGICFVYDVIENGNLKSLESMCEVVGQKPSRMFEYKALHTAISAYMKKKGQSETEEMRNERTIYTPRQFRAYLVEKDTTEPIAIKFWQNKFGINISEKDWLTARKCTTEIRLQLLHWKILHNIYPTNIMLNKMGISNSKYCDFCVNEIDYIEHFFYTCEKISCIWKCVENKIAAKFNETLKITVYDALIGLQNNNVSASIVTYANHLILIAKMCIGIYRYGTPIEIRTRFETELKIRNLV